MVWSFCSCLHLPDRRRAWLQHLLDTLRLFYKALMCKHIPKTQVVITAMPTILT